MKKRLLTLLLALGMLAGIAGCSNTPDAAATPAPSQGAEASGTGDAENSGTGEIDTEATLVIPVTADVVSLNMLQNCLRDTGLTMLGSMYDPFFTLNEDGSLNYYICENMEISEDGTEYVMTLRDDVTWHDGEPLTAEDVIFTFNALANGDLNVGITGGLSLDGEPVEMTMVDEYTVKFVLPRPANDYLYGLAIMYLIPKHIYENVEDMDTCEENMLGIGYGPYQLVEYSPGEKLVVERYEDYYKGPGNYKTIEYRVMQDTTAQEVALLNGEIDYFPVTDAQTLEKYKNDSNYNIHSFTEGRINYMQLNQNSPLFHDSDKAREAVCKALNIEEIVAGAYGSEELARPATGTVICAGEVYYNEDVPNYQQDLETAKQLVAETGLDQQPMRLIYNRDRNNMEETALIIQQQLRDVGIEVQITAMESSAFFESFFYADKGDWDIGLNGWSSSGRASYPSWYIKGSSYCLNTYTTDELNALWTAADTTTENPEEAYNEVSRLLQTYYTYVPISSTNKVIVTPANTHGWEDSPLGDLSDYSVLYQTK